MEYTIKVKVDLIKSNGECKGCFFEKSDDCPCDDCGIKNIFELVLIKEVKEE